MLVTIPEVVSYANDSHPNQVLSNEIQDAGYALQYVDVHVPPKYTVGIWEAHDAGRVQIVVNGANIGVVLLDDAVNRVVGVGVGTA